jgi:ribonuclease HI
MDLPSRLEERLKQLFARKRDRETFVVEAIEHSLAEMESGESDLPVSVGGTIHLYCDGGSRGNPGEAAVGCVIKDPLSGAILRTYKERIGVQTNNVAEYEALIAGLKLAKKYRPNRLVCHLDSELVVKQLRGEYRVKMPSLQPLVEQILSLKDSFSEVVFQSIAREENREADRLVNEALDGR